jgi:two-component system, sensor histidine kinase and response regulator
MGNEMEHEPHRTQRMATAVRWLIPLLIFFLGLWASVALSRTFEKNAKAAWLVRAEQSSRWLSGTVLNWLEETYSPLSGLLGLFENSGNVTEEEFINAYEGLESRSVANFLDNAAFLVQSDTGGWRIHYTSDLFGRLNPDADIETIPGMMSTLQLGGHRPQQAVVGPPHTDPDTGAVLSPVVFSFSGSEIPGAVVGILNYTRMMNGLYAQHVPGGLYLKVEGKFLGDGNTLAVVEKKPAETVLHSVTTRTKSGAADLSVAWHVSGRFAGGPKHQLAQFSLWAGIAGTLLITVLITLLLQREKMISGHVQTATAELVKEIADRQRAEEEMAAARAAAEAAREEAEAKSRELLHLVRGLPIPTALFDPDGHVLAINQAFTALLGYTVDDIPTVDAHWAPFYPDTAYREEIRNDWTGRVQRSAKTGQPIEPMDLAITAKTGAVYDLQAHTVQIGRFAATMWVDFTERKRMEKALSAERERLQQILDTSPVGVAFSTKGIVHFANPRFVEMFGARPGDPSPNLYVYPEDREALVARLSSEGRVDNHELEMYDKDHRVRDMLITYLPITYDGEEGILGWLLDITDRKQAEKAIRESERQHKTIFEKSPLGMVHFQSDGLLKNFNEPFMTLLGATREQLVGFNVNERLSDAHLKGAIQKALGGETDKYEGWYTSVTGKKRLYLSAIFTPIDEGAGKSEVIGIMEDITQRKKAEQELATAKEKAEELSRNFTDFLESTSDLVYLKDTELRYLACSKPLADMLGLADWREVIGKTGQDVQNENSLIRFKEEPERKVIEEGAVIELTEDIIRHGDKAGWASTVKKPLISGDGKIVGILSISRDITKMKEAEAALEAARETAEETTRAKSDFLANMSHEIRTPMNAIMGMAHLALKTELTPKQFDYLSKIDTSAKSLLGIINDILDFSKIEAGKLDMERVSFDLMETIENVGNLITVKAREKEHLEVLFHLDPAVPRVLKGDPLRLGQVLVNIGNNAVKFTETGEIVLTTRLMETAGDRVIVRFSIRDTGIGMTEAQRGRLFQAFSQADTSTTRKFGGTGLGLAISKRLVEMMDGEVRVESEPEQGSEFFFTATFGIGEQAGRKEMVMGDDRLTLKTLVVDDNRTARQILVEMLETFISEVHTAASGPEALQLMANQPEDAPFRLVLMDWKMPDMDGIETSMEILKRTRGKDVPKIILVTAYDQNEAQQAVRQIGIHGPLIKPVTHSSMVDAILRSLGKTEVTDKIRQKSDGLESTVIESIGGAQILLVEDNEINQQVACEILESAGLVVDVANDGQEGVEAVGKKVYDAVLMDIQMPVMSGIDASIAIRKDPRFTDLPIIAMTAHAMTGDREKSLDAGMIDHVTKPIDPDELFASLMRWIAPREGLGAEAAKGATPPKEKGRDVQIPEIDGMDTATGIKRVGGNKGLYGNLLVKFYEEYPKADGEIAAALKNNDRELAQRLAHTVKGVAGNIGAGDLQAVSGRLELAIKEGADADTPSLIAAFGETLGRTRSALKDFVTGQQAAKGEADGGRIGDADELRALLEKLEPHLRTRKPKLCKAVMGEIRAFQWPGEFDVKVAELAKWIGKYKFKEALSVLETIDNILNSK